MGFTALLDTAIGLTLIFLGAALFVTVANEAISGILNKRGKVLTANLKTLFEGTVLSDKLEKSPLFKSMLTAGSRIKSYVDPNVLAQALVGELAPKVAAGTSSPGGPKPLDLLPAIEAITDNPQLKNVLWSLAYGAGNDVEKLTRAMSVWIDRSLTVLGDSYKRWAQIWSFGLGLAAAIGFNIDTIGAAQRLYADKEMRDSAVAAAESYVKSATPDAIATCPKLDPEARKNDPKCAPIQNLLAEMSKRDGSLTKLPVGWASWKDFCDAIVPTSASLLVRLLGWILTALAISLGAPFWFDFLNRFINVRTTIRKPEAEAPAKA